MQISMVLGMGLAGLSLAGLIRVPDARGAGGLPLGPFEVTPSVFVSEQFEDNVCRTEKKKCSVDGKTEDGADTATVISPGLILLLPLRDHSVELSYQAEIARYASLDTENYTDQMAAASIDLNFPAGFALVAEDVYQDAHDPRGFSQNLELDLFKKNTATATVEQALGRRFVLDALFSDMMIDYDEDRNEFRNRSEQTIGGTLAYHVRPKTSVLAEYSHTIVSYDKTVETVSRDNKDDRILAGVSYELTAKSKGTIKGGMEQKKFEESDRDNYTGLNVSVSLDHEWTPKTLFSLKLERQSQESNLGGASGEKGQDFYVTAGGTLSVTHTFTSKISGTGQLAYGTDAYPEDQDIGTDSGSRTDNTFRFAAGAQYWILKWLNAAARIEYTRRTSTFDVFDYSSGIYSLTLGAIL